VTFWTNLNIPALFLRHASNKRQPSARWVHVPALKYPCVADLGDRFTEKMKNSVGSLVFILRTDTAMSSNGLLPSFLGALQASLSVLLVIFYGVIATQFKLLDGPTAKTISKVCVRMFLPALLITNLGSELIPARGLNYAVVLGEHLLACFHVVAKCLQYMLLPASACPLG